MTRRLWYIFFLVIFVLPAGVAFAGTMVVGYGPSRSAACQDAEQRARRDAAARNTCYSSCQYDSCREQDGEWRCRAEVSHHRGSCDGDGRIRP